MALKCEIMAAAEMTASTLQAPESNQAVVVDDSAAKTIEFLRARLLSERAASKAARQQAQEIAEKVKELSARLEMEVKNRKEAEAAMGKVVTILKAKGMDVDALASVDMKDQPERGVSTLDDIKEMNKDPEYFACRITDPSIDKEVSPTPSQNKKGEVSANGMLEKRKHSTRDPRACCDSENGIVSRVNQTAETCCNNREASLHAVHNSDAVQAAIREKFSSQDAAERERCRVQLAVTDKPMVYSDNICPSGTSDFKDAHTSQAFDEGSSITLKLKAMLQQIEEEVAMLPKEQPLKPQLQSWVEHVAGVLDTEKARASNGGSEVHGGSNNAGTNHPLKEATAFKTRSFLHTEEPIPLAAKENPIATNQMHDIPEGFDTREETGKTLSIVHQDPLLQANMSMVPPLTNYNEQFPSRMYTPTGQDPAAFHNRRSSHDAQNFLQPPPKMPMHPYMTQYGISQTSVGHAPSFANGYSANSHFTGAEAPYYIEAQSPRSSDVFSVGDSALKAGHGHEQWYETQSQGGYREDTLQRRSEAWSQAGLRSREMLSSPYIVDVSDDVHTKPRNIQLQRAHSYSHRTYMDHVRKAAEFNMAGPPKSLPLSDATLSITDDQNGRLGDILMVLDAARQHVNDQEQGFYAEEHLCAPPTPTPEDARLNRGYQYVDDLQQVPFEHLNHTWRSRARSSQTPIIQFPPSPASEHGGGSPFERRGRHRRSSSVSANFMMSGLDSYLQPRGEVQLGNGITLYTD